MFLEFEEKLIRFDMIESIYIQEVKEYCQGYEDDISEYMIYVHMINDGMVYSEEFKTKEECDKRYQEIKQILGAK